MKRLSTLVALFALTLTASGPTAAQNNTAQSGNLRIYWIDVEGGASTLFVSPSGQSLLFDTGYAVGDRDAKRIYEVAQKAGLKQIDHVVISHWHADHEGGLKALSKLMPLGRFYDHGNGVQPEDRQRLEDYQSVAGAKRTIVKPGDMIPFSGVQVQVVSSEGPAIAKAINGGGANPLCANAAQMGPAGAENQRMVGFLLSYGKFKLLSLADLDWQKEMELVCPINKLGTVSVYTVSRHGGLDDSGSPPLLGAIKPQVVVINNGPKKGLGQPDERAKPISAPGAAAYEKNSYLRLAKLPGIEGIWQEHFSMIDSDAAHNTARDMIANFEDYADHPANWIEASVGKDGKFTVTNSRNGFSKSYAAR
jgi:beta-lactamase superfamily II metal-dependent hydrolase